MQIFPKTYKFLAAFVLSAALAVTSLAVYTHKVIGESYKQKLIEAQEVFIKLQNYTDPSIKFTTLVVVDTPEINAWTDGSMVAITTGMIGFLHNKDELAFVLGHELGHVLLGHTSKPDDLGSQMHESNADKYGAYLAIRAGYDICAGKEIWTRFIEKYGVFEASPEDSHPSETKRQNDLDFPQCSL